MDEIDYSEYGSCPNCNAQWIHISQLGNENGITCCLYCYESERMRQHDEDNFKRQFQHKPLKSLTN